MYKAARTIAAEGTTITKGFHNLRRIPRRLVPHCGKAGMRLLIKRSLDKP